MIGSVIAHFRVVSELGRGGMGEVYRAEDLTLHRPVALKICAADDQRPRLLYEAQVASALNHPGIATVYEVGTFDRDGRPEAYIAMEYVPGKTLTEILREGAPPLEKILDIAAQVTEALAEAHARGVIHRDVKPSNVMVTEEGRVKVLDFGLAQYIPLVDESAPTLSRSKAPHGVSGDLVGTIAYMSPEQARGHEVDARTDIFSLGVILYELLSGRRPFTGGNSVELFDAILREEPPPLTHGGERVDPPLADLVGRMLAKERERRPATMRDVCAGLSDIRRGDATLPVVEPRGATVAVLSFQNITRSPDDDWLGTGIAETIATDLKGVDGLTLIPRERIEELLRTTGPRPVPEEAMASFVGRQMGALYVVEGGYQRMGDAVRVTAQVTDVSEGAVIHTVKIDGTMARIFELQDRIVRELSASLRPGSLAQKEADETEVVEAYEAYAKGLVNLKAESHESLDRAILFFERAVEKDPAYARAHLQLGSATALKAEYLGLPELHDQALRSLRKALELRPTLVEAFYEIGSVLMHLGRPDEGLQSIERALAQDPSDAAAHAAMGRVYFIGKADFARGALAFERSLRLNPQAGWSALQLSHCAALLREFERGEDAARRAIARQEEFGSGKRGIILVGAHMRMGHLFALQGRGAEAREQFEHELLFLSRVDHALKARVFIELHMRLGSASLQMGDRAMGEAALDMALEAFERRIRLGNDDPFTRFYAAAAYALRGDDTEALDSLEKAARRRPAFTVARARIEPEFERLRSTPRFVAFLNTPGF
jgi:serine/threonine protein kinase/tetratricopeptide (TPR) repeat protein